MCRRGLAAAVLAAAALLGPATRAPALHGGPPPPFTPAELGALAALWIGNLGPPPPDPSNTHADDPRAARLGRAIFVDPRWSASGRVACATCHLPALGFQDGRPVAQGEGPGRRRTLPLAGAAHHAWLSRDGGKDSLWAQALGSLERPIEHGLARTRVAALVLEHRRAEYEAAFGPLPALPAGLPAAARPAADDPRARAAWERLPPAVRDGVTRVHVNVGKALGAFVRSIRPAPAPFDRYAEAILVRDVERAAGLLEPAAVRGLRLFLGRARCAGCHAGPLLTDGRFHALGVPPRDGAPADRGRAAGLQQALTDEFSCRSRWSDARPEQCAALRAAEPPGRALEGAFRTPSLRNVAARPPYMHAGQLPTLGAAIALHAGTAGAGPKGGPLAEADLADLEAFLRTLTGPVLALDDPPAR